MRFAVDVVHGQKTGFFLDQRENRRAIRPFAAGVDVVNLFGYTGGFSVHAALAGARRVTTVDVAAAALADARNNFALNGLDPARHGFDAEDAFAWLERAARRRPPLRPRHHRSAELRPVGEGAAEGAHRLPRSARPRARPRRRRRHPRRRQLLEPRRPWTPSSAPCATPSDKTRRPLRILELRGQPADHPTPPAFPEGRYLKFVLARAD